MEEKEQERQVPPYLHEDKAIFTPVRFEARGKRGVAG
jgi:hypothetical protein